MKRSWIVFAFLFLLLCGTAGVSFFSAPTAAAQMPPTPTSDRLAPWPTVYPPGQADLGAQEYYQRCMVCHGDRGQGLTDEWRGVLDVEDQNCWQSGCHNPHHPPDGFIFPTTVPALVGGSGLSHFGTAQNLFNYIKHSMPYQAPESLSDEIYWQLTAYLMRSNGYYSGSPILSEETAASIHLIPQQAAAPIETASPRIPWWPFMLAGLVLVGWGAVRLSRSRR